MDVGRIIDHLPGVSLGYSDDDNDDDNRTGENLLPLNKIVIQKLQFIRPGQLLKSICSIVPTFRKILEGHWHTDVYNEALKNLRDFLDGSRSWRDHLQSQLWRLQDLNEGGALGYSVELYLLALQELSIIGSLEGTHDWLYTGTFRAITADWSNFKHSLGTRKLLLSLVTSEFRLVLP